MQLRRVHNLSDALEPGDYFVVSDGHIVLCCPFCGKHRQVLDRQIFPMELHPAALFHTVVSVDPLTLTPSVVCPWNQCHFVVANGVAT